MPHEAMVRLPLACDCGAVRGVLRADPGEVTRVICHCDDCQLYLHAIDRGDLLDPFGGTELLQTSPAHLEITEGKDRLVCLRLTDRGMVRWYAECCRTPLGNTLLSRNPPFIGVLRRFVRSDPIDEAVGPLYDRVQTRFAKGGRAAAGGSVFPWRLLLRTARVLARWWRRGDGARSPLRDPSGAPAVAPRVLPAAELDAVRARAAAWLGG